jgi:hypothetical protein
MRTLNFFSSFNFFLHHNTIFSHITTAAVAIVQLALLVSTSANAFNSSAIACAVAAIGASETAGMDKIGKLWTHVVFLSIAVSAMIIAVYICNSQVGDAVKVAPGEAAMQLLTEAMEITANAYKEVNTFIDTFDFTAVREKLNASPYGMLAISAFDIVMEFTRELYRQLEGIAIPIFISIRDSEVRATIREAPIRAGAVVWNFMNETFLVGASVAGAAVAGKEL